MPGHPLHLHRAYRDYADGRGVLDRAPSRLFLKVRIVHPRTLAENPTWFEAILDTGAERTVVPLVATEYFDRSSPAKLFKSTPGRLILADGTPRENVPSFDVALHFQGHAADRADGRSITVKFEGRRLDGSWRGIPCFAFEYSHAIRNHHGERQRFNQVILGMDILRHWRVTLDGPSGQYLVAIDPDAG